MCNSNSCAIYLVLINTLFLFKCFFFVLLLFHLRPVVVIVVISKIVIWRYDQLSDVQPVWLTSGEADERRDISFHGRTDFGRSGTERSRQSSVLRGLSSSEVGSSGAIISFLLVCMLHVCVCVEISTKHRQRTHLNAQVHVYRNLYIFKLIFVFLSNLSMVAACLYGDWYRFAEEILRFN